MKYFIETKTYSVVRRSAQHKFVRSNHNFNFKLSDVFFNNSILKQSYLLYLTSFNISEFSIYKRLLKKYRFATMNRTDFYVRSAPLKSILCKKENSNASTVKIYLAK